jgi:ribosomal protein S6
MAEITKTAMERTGKATEMERIINALTTAGIEVERVVDNGTLAYMITEGALEGRFITIKVVLTKEYSEETGKGFDITEGIAEYELKVQREIERAEKAKAKAAERAEKKAKADKVKVEA